MSFLVMTVALLPLTGILCVVMPWIQRAGECFAVTVPVSAQSDPRIRGYKMRYTIVMAVLTAAMTALVAGLAAAGVEGPMMIVFIVSLFVLLGVSFGLMLYYRSKVIALKRESGWQAEGDLRATVIAEKDVPGPVALGWEALNVPVILATLAVGLMLYPSMPDKVPMHMDLVGNVNSWTDKGIGVVLFPVLTQAIVLASMIFSHWSIIRSKSATSADAPVSTAYAYGLFAHAQSVLLVALGALINLAFICMPLSFAGILTMGQAALAVGLVALVAVVASIVVSLVYGQAGSRVIARVADDGSMPTDDDAHWVAGVFYVNRDDPSLFLPERFGVGWTVNLGRPVVWAIMAVFVAVMIAFVVLSIVMVG
jgi:uncharacterized membrane protein